MKSYLVIGYANYVPKDRINYENSLKHFGYHYKIVGDGETWINFIESKIRSCYNYIKNLNKKLPEIIICTDCFDVLASRTPDKLIQDFERICKKENKRIVIGMENVCGGNCEPIISLQDSDKEFKYINGGFYMGYTKDILNLWKEILTYGLSDDQKALGTYINKHPNLFHLDTDSNFVGNIHYKTHHLFRWDSEKGIPYRVDTQKCPYFLHFPGWTSGLGLYIDDYGNFLEIKYQSHNFTDKLKAITDMGMKFQVGIIIFIIIVIFIVLYFFSANHK